MQDQDQYLGYLIDPRSQGVNRFFVLSFEYNVEGTGHSGCFLPVVEIKNYTILIDCGNAFDQPIKHD